MQKKGFLFPLRKTTKGLATAINSRSITTTAAATTEGTAATAVAAARRSSKMHADFVSWF